MMTISESNILLRSMITYNKEFTRYNGQWPLMMYLETDGRDTEINNTIQPDGSDHKCVIARFACPACGEYGLILDAGEHDYLEATDACECFNCRFGLLGGKSYKDWQAGDIVEMIL
jgi:hypothetical protein